MLSINQTHYFLYLLFFIVSVKMKAQDSLSIRVDSVFSYDTLKIKNLQSLFLAANEDDITFFISNYKRKDSLYFQCGGIDKSPLPLRNNNIRYTNIRGGDYSFVLAQLNDGKLDTLSMLPIRVASTIVEEALFYPSLIFSLLLIFASIIYLWLSYNFRQKIKIQGLRNQIASDLHDEVGSTLSSIAVLSKVLRRNIATKTPESLPVLDKILLTSRETIINLRDTVWAINPANDSFEKLMSKMRSYANEMILGEEIQLNYHNVFESEKSHKVLNISMEQRRNIYLMFKECVHNIVKHAKATAVDIDITMQGDLIRIFIKDNGQGFDLQSEKEGNGLENLKRRAKECFIDLDIQSAPQNGTIVTMLVPEL